MLNLLDHFGVGNLDDRGGPRRPRCSISSTISTWASRTTEVDRGDRGASGNVLATVQGLSKADSLVQQRFDSRPHQSAQVLVRQARLQLANITEEPSQSAPDICWYILEHNC